MNSRIKLVTLLLAGMLAADAFSLAITSKPVLIAFAKRAADHPYAYQVTTDAAAGTVVYSLITVPRGMVISSTGLISRLNGRRMIMPLP